MAANDNTKILKAVFDAFNAKDMNKLASYHEAGAKATSVPFGATGSAVDDWQAWARAFPDGNIEVKNMIAQGDYVFAEIIGRGTHAGTLSGPTGDIPATGRKVEMPLAEVYRFRNGKIAEGRYYFDGFSFLKQLGIGAPEVAGEARSP